MKTRLGGRTWAALLTFGLFGQIAWVIENMYFNVFQYNTISGDTSMIAAMVAWSAVTATVTTLVMGALSDPAGAAEGPDRHRLSAVGRQHRGLRLHQKKPPGRCGPQRGGAGGGDGLRHDLLRLHRQRRRLQRLGHGRHRAGKPGPGGDGAGHYAAGGRAGGVRSSGRPDPGRELAAVFPDRGRHHLPGRRAGLLLHPGTGPAPGPGQLFCQHSVRLPSRRCPGQPAAVSVPGGSGRILHEPAGVYALPHYLYPAVPGHHGLYPPAGGGADRQLRAVGAGRAAHRPLREAPLPGPGGDPGALRGWC